MLLGAPVADVGVQFSKNSINIGTGTRYILYGKHKITGTLILDLKKILKWYTKLIRKKVYLLIKH